MKQYTAHRGHITQLFAALLVGVIAVPTAMTGLFQSIDSNDINADFNDVNFIQKAVEDRARVRQVRRDYWRAVDIYNELRRIGIDGIYPPDINDSESVNYYLDSSNFVGEEIFIDEELFGAAPSMEMSEAWAQYHELPEQYRDLLDGYISTRRCPGTLRQYHLAGFYELCQSLLDETIAATMPQVVERSAYLRGFNPVGQSPVSTLRRRLMMMEESLNVGGGIRPQGEVGQRRPRLDYSEYHQ